MAKYRITINLNSISYELEAKSDLEAVEYAQECFYTESLYDVIKWADYEIEEFKTEEVSA